MFGLRDKVETALRDHRVLRISYQGANASRPKTRDIEIYESDGVYVDAYCRRAGEKRTFRFDRILSAELLPQIFVPSPFVAEEIERSGWARKSGAGRRKLACALTQVSGNFERPRHAVPAKATEAAPSIPVSRPQPAPASTSAGSNNFGGKFAAAILIFIVGWAILSNWSGGRKSSPSSYRSYSPAPSYAHSGSDWRPEATSAPAPRTAQSYVPQGQVSNRVAANSSLLEPATEKPLVAENGSFYGELNDYGVPKTVYVRGYTRSDGTYVRSHYRAPPYSSGLSQKSIALPRLDEVSKPRPAENGSYYGQISNLTGKPKTTYVSGYYRKDGTYVRSHYRSK